MGSSPLKMRFNFKFKTEEIQPTPNWPSILKFLSVSGISVLNMKKNFECF